MGLIEDKEASEDDTRAAEAFLDYVESDAAIKVLRTMDLQHMRLRIPRMPQKLLQTTRRLRTAQLPQTAHPNEYGVENRQAVNIETQ